MAVEHAERGAVTVPVGEDVPPDRRRGHRLPGEEIFRIAFTEHPAERVREFRHLRRETSPVPFFTSRLAATD